MKAQVTPIEIEKIILKDKKVILRRRCPVCGMLQKLSLTFEQYEIINFVSLINDKTVPFLTAYQREFFISGMCDYCLDELFK